jgi:hypothetical protein
MKTTLKVPTFLLGYLINADAQGLTVAEETTVKQWESDNKVLSVSTANEEEYFSHTNDISNNFGGCNVMDCYCTIDNN